MLLKASNDPRLPNLQELELGEANVSSCVAHKENIFLKTHFMCDHGGDWTRNKKACQS